MKKLLGALMFLVIGVMFIPVVMNSIDSYDVGSASYTEITDETDYWSMGIPDACDINFNIENITINGVELGEDDLALVIVDDFTCTNDYVFVDIEPVDASIAVGDEITVNYIYDMDVPVGVDGLINVVGILFVIGIVVGGVAYIKFSN